MKETLRSAFKKVKDYFAGEPPVNSMHMDEFDAIADMMKERGCKLDFAFEHTWSPGTINNVGIIADDKTSVYEIMHAEGNFADVHQIVTGRPLDKENIMRYKPEDVSQETPFYPGMF